MSDVEETVENQATSPSKQSLWATFKDNLAFLSSLIAVVTFIGGYLGWGLGSENVESRVAEYADITNLQLMEAIEQLPGTQKTVFMPLVAAVDELSRVAATGGDVTEAKQQINAAVTSISKISENVEVRTYDATTSPFYLPLQTTVLICDNKVSVAFQNTRFAKTNARLAVAGRATIMRIGSVISAKVNGMTARVTLLELLEDSQEAVLSFTCKSKS